jgi:YebC/PmpR family DNA-binding regulatory protein
MAGHSKFKNIMHRKGAQDKKRAKIFTRMIKEIIVAAKSGLPDPAANPRLRAAILAARSENVPKDKIEAAIKRGSGSADSDNYEEIHYEGYGVGGVAFIVDCMTDNRNRTASDVRAAFTKCGGNLGEHGSVSFMFNKVGEITYPLTVASPDDMLEAAIEAGADDASLDDETHRIITEIGNLHETLGAIEAKYGEPKSARIVWQPQIMAPTDEDKAASIFKLIDLLEDLDDVQEVTTNMELSDEILQKLSS